MNHHEVMPLPENERLNYLQYQARDVVRRIVVEAPGAGPRRSGEEGQLIPIDGTEEGLRSIGYFGIEVEYGPPTKGVPRDTFTVFVYKSDGSIQLYGLTTPADGHKERPAWTTASPENPGATSPIELSEAEELSLVLGCAAADAGVPPVGMEEEE